MEARTRVVETPLRNVMPQRRGQRCMQSCSNGIDRTSYTGHCPGLRIPSIRNTPRRREIVEKVDPEQIALLVKQEWKLSYVTPLYLFRHTQLKFYSRQLSAFIVAERQPGIAMEIKATFSVILGLAVTNDDAETVFIRIHTKNAFAGREDAEKVVWSGWLTCINGDLEYLRSLPDGFVSLPLFCTRGTEALTTLVKSWFQRTFDCCFGPLCVTSTNLHWLAALWTGCHSDTSIHYLKLVWRLPVLPPLDVTYTIHPQDALELWNSVRQEAEGSVSEDSVRSEEVTRFVKALEAQFFHHFKIDLSAGKLMQVATALGSARHSGRIKILSCGYMITLLMLLTECALLKMPL